MTQDIHEMSRRKPNFFQTLKAVSWGFLGVRKGAGHDEDIAKLNPVHLIIAGLLGGLVFVLVLLLLVRIAIASLS